MTEGEFVKKFLTEGQSRYVSQGLPKEHFLIDVILDYHRLVAKERNSFKAKRKAKKEASK